MTESLKLKRPAAELEIQTTYGHPCRWQIKGKKRPLNIRESVLLWMQIVFPDGSGLLQEENVPHPQGTRAHWLVWWVRKWFDPCDLTVTRSQYKWTDMGDSGQICKAVLSTILTKTPKEVFWIMWCPCFLYESMLKCTAAVLMTHHLTKTFSFPLICQPLICSAPFRSVLLTPLKSFFFIFFFLF